MSQQRNGVPRLPGELQHLQSGSLERESVDPVYTGLS